MRGVVFWYCLALAVVGCGPAPAALTPVPSPTVSAPTRGQIPITSRSSAARSLYLRGRALNENLQPHEAHALFEQAVALDSNFAMAEYGLGATAPTAKEVRDHLDRAIALAVNATEGERLLIRTLIARTDAGPTAWAAVADSLVLRYPEDERAQWILGSAYSAQQQYDSAIVHYKRAIAINPRFSLAYNSEGYAHRGAGDFVAAEAAFQRYIAMVPDDPNPYDSYAELLMKLGRFDESIVQYDRAQLIDPHFSGSFVGIAADHLYAGRPAAAIAEAERYLGVARDDHERRAALLTLALVQVDMGATEDALRTMERMYALAEAIGDVASMSGDAMAIGDILLAAGRLDEATMRFRKASDIVAASILPPAVKIDTELLTQYILARLALARHDVAAAHRAAATFMQGAVASGNTDRMRQSRELNGLIALAAGEFTESLRELARADQQNPAVLAAMATAYRGSGDPTRADAVLASALTMYTLPTWPYIFVRTAARQARRLTANRGTTE